VRILYDTEPQHKLLGLVRVVFKHCLGFKPSEKLRILLD
jgi:hypothetical protein